jgi:nucleoid-associated protein YgaU
MGNEQLKSFLITAKRYQIQFKVLLLGILLLLIGLVISYKLIRQVSIPQITNDIRIDQLRNGENTPGASATPSATPKPAAQNTDATKGISQTSSSNRYVVQKGDTLGSISTSFYGTPRYSTLLAQANRISNTVIKAGQVLTIPKLNDSQKVTQVKKVQVAQKKVAPQAKGKITQAKKNTSTYVVKKGDSLWKISAHKYQAGRKWPKIYNANKQKIGANPNKIYPKTVLKIPAKQ